MLRTLKTVSVVEWVNGLSAEQMSRIYEIIDGPIPAEIDSLSDEELIAALTTP